MNTDEAVKLTVAALKSLVNPGGTKKKLPKIESKKYPEIYVFRHGETFDNRNKIFCGRRDSKITERGKKQARVLAEKLKNKQIDVCVISSLSRSKLLERVVGIKISISLLGEISPLAREP